MSKSGLVSGVLLVHALLLGWVWTHQADVLHAPEVSEAIIAATVMVETPSRAEPQAQRLQPKPLPQHKAVLPAPPAVDQPTPVQATSTPSAAAPVVQTVAQPLQATAAVASVRKAPEPDHVVLPSTQADYLDNPIPPYPRMSRRLGEEGTVLVGVLINTEGRAEQAQIRTSSGFARLDETALETVKRWRYVPGKRNGVAQAMWFNVPIRFVLN